MGRGGSQQSPTWCRVPLVSSLCWLNCSCLSARSHTTHAPVHAAGTQSCSHTALTVSAAVSFPTLLVHTLPVESREPLPHVNALLSPGALSACRAQASLLLPISVCFPATIARSPMSAVCGTGYHKVLVRVAPCCSV